MGRGGGAVSGRRPAPPVRPPPPLLPPGAWLRRTVGLGWSVVPLPLRRGVSRQVSAGGGPSASAARGADSRRCPRTLRRRPPPRPPSLGRDRHAPPRPLRARGVSGGVRPGARRRGLGAGGSGRSGSTAWPLTSGPAGVRARSLLPRVPSRRPALGSPLPRWQQVQGAPGPSSSAGSGPVPFPWRSSARLCMRPARALASFLLPVVTLQLVRRLCGFYFTLSPNLMCPPGCLVSSLCFSYFPVIKTVVENRSFFFPRALATFHTLCALLGRRIQCFGVCHSDIKLFLLVAPAWRRSSASPVATPGKRSRLGSGATCCGAGEGGGLTPAVF